MIVEVALSVPVKELVRLLRNALRILVAGSDWSADGRALDAGSSPTGRVEGRSWRWVRRLGHRSCGHVNVGRCKRDLVIK